MINIIPKTWIYSGIKEGFVRIILLFYEIVLAFYSIGCYNKQDVSVDTKTRKSGRESTLIVCIGIYP